MLKVFVSSTQKDLKIEREIIIDRLNESLSAVGMEIFGTDGRITSQEIALLDEKTGLKNCDLVIFILTPHYGSIIDECKITECKADCYFKNDKTKKISFTHCEYKFAESKNIPCQVYIIDNEWEIVNKLQESGLKEFDWNVLIKIPEIQDHFSKFKDELHIRHLFSIKDEVLNFKKEVEKYNCPRFNTSEDITKITGHLADNIVKWYFEDKIQIRDFCGRKRELKELMDKMDDSIEVHGVGGVGKTTLIHVALLIQILKGKKVITIGKKQSYFSGSGYKHFKEKCKKSLHEVIGESITINDIVDALDFKESSKIEGIPEKIDAISKKIDDENILFFIDDFHLADKNVQELVKSSKRFVLSSKKLSGVARNEVHLSGIDEKERDLLIDIISRRLGKSITDLAKGKIKKITEGHPVSTELLVRNSERIDFNNLENIKPDALDFSNPDQVQEFIERLVDFIIKNKDTFILLKNLSLINTEIETDIDRKIIHRTFPEIDSIFCFNELIDTGVLEKKPQYEGVYQFSFKHIQDSLREDNTIFHKKSVDYYKNKIHLSEDDIDSQVELLFHEFKMGYDNKLLDKFSHLSNKVRPISYGYKRLLEVGKLLEPFIDPIKISQFYYSLGSLYTEINWYDSAEEALLFSLSNQRELANRNRKKHIHFIAGIQSRLGILYINLNRYQKAESSFIEAKEIYEKYPAKNPIKQLSNLAKLDNNLGLVYLDQNKYDESEKKFKSGLITISRIPKRYFEDRNEDLLILYGNLGNVYCETKRYKDAELAYKNAVNIAKPLSVKSPGRYNEQYAGTLNNLGNLYNDISKFYDAEKYYKDSLEIIEKLVIKNPDKYSPDLARVQNNLGLVLTNLKKFDDAKKVYYASYLLIKNLYNQNQEAFFSTLIDYTNNFGTLFIEMKEYDRALELFYECLGQIEGSSQKNSDPFLNILSETHYNLGIVYLYLKKFPESEKHLQISLQNRESLVSKKYSAYLPGLTHTKIKFGLMLLKNNRSEESEIKLKEALENSRKLVKSCPEAFFPILAESLNNYGKVCLELERFKDSKDMLNEAIVIRRELVKKCKEAFYPELADSLNSFGILCYTLKRFEESEEKLREAYNIGHNMVDRYGSPYVSQLFDTLTNLEKLYKSNASEKADAISHEIKLLTDTYDPKYY